MRRGDVLSPILRENGDLHWGGKEWVVRLDKGKSRKEVLAGTVGNNSGYPYAPTTLARVETGSLLNPTLNFRQGVANSLQVDLSVIEELEFQPALLILRKLNITPRFVKELTGDIILRRRAETRDAYDISLMPSAALLSDYVRGVEGVQAKYGGFVYYDKNQKRFRRAKSNKDDSFL